MSAIATIGVIGAGAMGRGIAELAARQGFTARLNDVRDGAAEAALATIAGTLDRDVEKGRLVRTDADAIRARITAASLLDTARCDLIVEAIVEDLAAKQALLAAIEAEARPDAILATNTSSLSVAKIGENLRHPGRFAGLHFFNPPIRMRVVEVVRAPATADGTIAALRTVADRLGQRAFLVGDTPGFLVNHLGRGYVGEALRILDEGAATPAELDTIARNALGFRMGPCELLDLTGLDVSAEVTRQVWRGFDEEPRFRLAPIAEARVAAGLLGRKSGRGFYEYGADGKMLPAAAKAAPTGTAPVVPDLATVPAQRLAAMIVLVGCDAAGRDIASPADIDAAAKLALAWPRGPLALGDAIGAARIAAIAAELHILTGDPCWRPSPWLDAHVAAGTKLTSTYGGDDIPADDEKRD
jgi:3-hydroxybutyryl-CoA dehydrogenase